MHSKSVVLGRSGMEFALEFVSDNIPLVEEFVGHCMDYD